MICFLSYIEKNYANYLRKESKQNHTNYCPSKVSNVRDYFVGALFELLVVFC